MPEQIISDLGLDVRLARRRYSSYTPEPGTDRDVILFNILLNLRRETEARRMLALLPKKVSQLDRCHCVMLRNSSHLYDEKQARTLLAQAWEGFRHHGSAFGEATTLNNIGVLQIRRPAGAGMA